MERWAAGPVAPVVVDDAPVQQVAQPRPDLYKIPTPTLCLGDGGPYYANSVVVAKGLKPGDVVVAEGQIRVQPGAPVKVVKVVPAMKD